MWAVRKALGLFYSSTDTPSAPAHGEDLFQEHPSDPTPPQENPSTSDAIAKAHHERKNLTPLFFKNQPLHTAVENSPFVKELRENPNKESYLKYLLYLYDDMKVLEGHLKTVDFKGKELFDFDPYFRSEKLLKDILAFNGIISPSQPTLNEHVTHFNALANEAPFLLIAHAAMRYYAILFGGQSRSERLKKVWGDETSLTLYEFPMPPQQMIRKLSDMLNAFGATLSDEEWSRFDREVITAWIFSGDILEVDIRELAKRK